VKSLIARVPVAVFGGAVLFALGPVSPALAAPTQVTLHLAGTHPVSSEGHEGTFTASAPLCAAGSWAGSGAGARLFTCSDASGTFTARFEGDLEHTTGATGGWTIIAGSGKYTTLRGQGTGTVDYSTGEGVTPITFSDTWAGVVDFDATAPTGSVKRVEVVRPTVARGRWRVRVEFSARDNIEENAVAFTASATAGPFLLKKTGTVTAGTATFMLVFHRPMAMHYLKLEIDLRDPWGNESTIRKKIKLR
jgi:hypothetical protein